MTGPGFTIWLTGLSGAGKSTLAKSIAQYLQEYGYAVEVLDGAAIRTSLSKGLGFSREDRDLNGKRIAHVCKLLNRNGVICVAAAISPYRDTRAWARREIDRFAEIYVKCPLEVCRQRDLQGLYKLADAGQQQALTGVDDPYEEPEHPELTVETDKETPGICIRRIFKMLAERGYLASFD